MSESKGHSINAWVVQAESRLVVASLHLRPARDRVRGDGSRGKDRARASCSGPRALGLLRWIHGPEPVPRRPGVPLDKPAEENLTDKERDERIATAYRKAVQILHPDKASDGPVDRDAATSALTELYDAAIGR